MKEESFMEKINTKNEMNKKLLAAIIAIIMCFAAFLPIGNAAVISKQKTTIETQTTNHLHPNNPNFRTTWYVPGDFFTIQAAIDSTSVLPGDTIIVAAGTYTEDQITINKALTIQGAGWATTIIDGSDALLTNAGLIRIIATGDVTFSGFTIQNAGGPSNGDDGGDGRTNIGIDAQSSSSSATFNISWNKIIGTNNPDDYEDYGLYAHEGLEKLIFTHNIVTQAGANSLLIEINPGSTDISYNTIDAGCWGTSPIYHFTYSGNDITTLQKVSNNTIDVSTGSNPRVPGPDNNKITGISFSGAWKGYNGYNDPTDTGKYTNIVLSNNFITGVGVWNRGISLDNFAQNDGIGGEISNAIIKGNILTGTSSPTDYDSSQCFGIRLSGLVTNTIIRENHITHCCYSFFGTCGFSTGAESVYPTGTIVHYNVFMTNGYGLRWEGPTTLNALYNYWGSASGPTPMFSGDGVYGDVDYTPYIDNDPPWTVNLHFKKQTNPAINDDVYFGEKIDASDREDAYDVPKPPLPGPPYIYAFFDANLASPYNKLYEDYRQFLHEQMTWDLYVQSNTGAGTTNVVITWTIAQITASEYDFVGLYDAAGTTLLANMKTTNTYTIVGLPDNIPIQLKIKEYVNHVPTSADVSITMLGDTQYTFTTTDFPFSDVDGNTFQGIKITTLETVGALKLNGVDVILNQVISAADIATNKLTYDPVPDESGDPYTTFSFKVYDGLAYSSLPYQMSISVIQRHVISVNTNWNLISIPCYDNINKNNIIVRVGGTDYTWTQAVSLNYIVTYLYSWDRIGQHYDPIDVLEPGQGYWCWAYVDCEFLIWSDAIGTGEITYLKTNWNIMGLPYETTLPVTNSHIVYGGTTYSWADAVTNHIILGFVYGWSRTGQTYTLETSYQPGYGYWMYAYHDCTLIQ